MTECDGCGEQNDNEYFRVIWKYYSNSKLQFNQLLCSQCTDKIWNDSKIQTIKIILEDN